MKKRNSPFKKVLIANRGEIACRLITACHGQGLKTVAVYSEADAQARHVRLADEAILLGAGPVGESYLNIEKLIDAAKKSGAEAIHPGYGFFSENATFAEAVIEAGLNWIGPDPKTIQLLGNKIEAKKVAEKAGVPTLPWANLIEGWKPAALTAAAQEVGFPLLLKAAAGGGGRGMRLVERNDELLEKAEAAMREAQGAFGSSEIFLERFCPVARHIEVQILGDTEGAVLTLGERECSAQRRHQKVIEEAPASNLSEKTRAALWKASLNLARKVGYVSAGTCEFLVDEKEDFYFLEMNTRLQVEHPVTELVWGVDLPALQLRIARGEGIGDLAATLKPRGHAIEARVYAEDPSKNFIPSPGRLEAFRIPALSHLRVDTGYEAKDEVPVFYDAMLAKVIAWGMDREQARRVLAHALSRATVAGVAWNGAYLVDILNHQRFIDGKISTNFLAEAFSAWKGVVRQANPEEPVGNVANDAVEANGGKELASPWVAYGSGNGKVGSGVRGTISRLDAHRGDQRANPKGNGALEAEYPGKVLRVFVSVGDVVEEGQTVVTCESMKMEYAYVAPSAARVQSIDVKEGQVIPAGAVLIQWENFEG